jgi:hypothetical protein
MNSTFEIFGSGNYSITNSTDDEETKVKAHLATIIIGYLLLISTILVLLNCCAMCCASTCEDNTCCCFRRTQEETKHVTRVWERYGIAETDIDSISIKIIDNSCIICLDEITESDKISRLGCKHIFHQSCIDEWYKNGDNDTCPICRTEISDNDLTII